MATRARLPKRKKQGNPRIGIAWPYVFAATVVLLLSLFRWPLRWLISGAPILTYSLLLGGAYGTRVLPIMPLWTLLPVLNLVYAVAATSWLLYWWFLLSCYPVIFISCIFQFNAVADFVRKNLRRFLQQLHFINDKIAMFDLPALEIDTEVQGLLVIRGISISLSSLTIVAHGIEVGIKLSDDMELAIATDSVTIKLFRSIEIADCFANIKGGEYEMSFGNLAENTYDEDGDALMLTDTPLLRAAAGQNESTTPEKIKMTEKMTENSAPKDSSAQSVYEGVTQMSPDHAKASDTYRETLKQIEKSSAIHESRRKVVKLARSQDAETTEIDIKNSKDMRVAICADMHNKPSVPHPPRRSIRVTTLQNLSSQRQREFMHRLPLLLRLLLNPLSYLHSITISSITAAGSGKWIQHMLSQHIFQNYGEQDSEIRKLEARISMWLTDANFAVQLADISSFAQVPILTQYDVIANLSIDDLMVYRSMPDAIDLKQVVRLGGADCKITVPSFLLPHHEHLLPPYPTAEETEAQEQKVADADGVPKTMQAKRDLAQVKKDETNVKISAHAKLPACFDQELLNFVAALVKATKVIEIEKESSAWDSIREKEVHGLKDFTKAFGSGMKDTMKRAAVDAIGQDRWIAKLVGKITKKLEKAQGDVGYSGDIPVALKPYRDLAESAPKILP